LYIDRAFETTHPLVLTFERRGKAIATKSATSLDGSQRIPLNDTINLDLLLLRDASYDDDFISETKTTTSTVPLPGFEPVIVRVSVRESSAHGKVRDCAAINLAKFATGAHGLTVDTIILQLGSQLSMSVKTDFQESTIRNNQGHNGNADDEMVNTQRNIKQIYSEGDVAQISLDTNKDEQKENNARQNNIAQVDELNRLNLQSPQESENEGHTDQGHPNVSLSCSSHEAASSRLYDEISSEQGGKIDSVTLAGESSVFDNSNNDPKTDQIESSRSSCDSSDDEDFRQNSSRTTTRSPIQAAYFGKAIKRNVFDEYGRWILGGTFSPEFRNVSISNLCMEHSRARFSRQGSGGRANGDWGWSIRS
jgi:hypothetical protein